MGRITQLQLIMLFILFQFSTIVGFTIGPLAKTSGYDAWLALIIAGLIGLCVAYLNFIFARRRPQQFFFHYGKDIVGKWLHVPLALIMLLFFMHAASLVLREFEDFLVMEYYRRTPNWAICSALGICTALAVRSGIEAIFRCAQGFFFITIGAIFLVPFFVNKEMNFSMAIAFTKIHEWLGIWHGSYMVGAMFGEMFMILVFFPCLKEAGKTMRSLGLATLIAIVCILSHLLPAILIFSPGLMGNLTYPELELMRYIRVGDFLENLDPVLVALWVSSLFVKISLFLYCAVFGLSQLLNLKDYRPLTFSSTVIMVTLSLAMAQGASQLSQFLKNAGYTFAYFCEIAIPLFYFIVDTIRRRRVKPAS